MSFGLSLIERETPLKPWMEKYNFVLVQSIEHLSELVDKAIASPYCAFDLESTGLDVRTFKGIPVNRVVGYSIAFESDTCYYIPVRHKVETSRGKNLPLKETNTLIQKLLLSAVIVGHNWLKFDSEMMLASDGIVIKKFKQGEDITYHDSYILARLAGYKSSGLKNLSKALLDKEMIEIKDVVINGKEIDFGSVSPFEGLVYAASDAICTKEIFEHPSIQLPITEQKFIYNLERKVFYVVRNMERNKIKLNVEYCKKLDADLLCKIEEIQNKCYAIVSEKTNDRIKTFQLDSPKEVSDVLFNIFDMNPKPEKGKTGYYKTDDSTLEALAPNYELAKILQEYRSLTKFQRTYTNNMLINVDKDGYLKFQFSPMATDTGRFASPGGGTKGDGCSGVNVQCLSGETYVLIKDKGFIKIKEVSGKNVIIWDGEKYVSAKCVSSGKKKKISVFFQNGQEFISSPDHRYLCRDEICSYPKFKKPFEFNKREGVVLSSEVPDFDNYVPFNNIFIKSVHNKKFETLDSLENKYELGIILGRLASDGGLSENRRAYWVVAKHEYNILPKLKNILEKIGIVSIKKDRKKSLDKKGNPYNELTRLMLNSVHLVEQISTLNLKKEIHPRILSSKELLRGFLCGYIDGDGGISANQVAVAFAGTEEKFEYAKMMQKCLTLFGIQSRVKFYPGKSVRLRLCRGSQEDFINKIGFINKIKNKKIKSLGNTKKITRHKNNVQNVKKVIEHEEYIEMFDIVGCENERFAADGFIVHNSTPARYDLTKPNIRKCLSCEPDEVFVAMDWAGVELRIGANMSQEPIWLDRFLNGDGDLHTSTASIIYGKAESEVKKDERQAGKGFNFQALYGGGPSALANAIGSTVDDAREKQQRFFGKLTVLKSYINGLHRFSRKSHYSLTKFGRKRSLAYEYTNENPAIRAGGDRLAVNSPIQGTAADLMKLAMVKIDEYIEDNGYRDIIKMVLTMHDELCFVVKKKHVDKVVELENVMKLTPVLEKIGWKVPLAVDVEIGESWDVQYNYKTMQKYLKETHDVDNVAFIYGEDQDYSKHLEAYEAYEKSEKDKKKEKEAPISGASKSEKTKEDFKKAGTALLTKDFEQEVTEVKEVKIEKISNDLIDTVPSEVKETASAAENLDNAFKVLKTASLGDLPMEAHVKLKKSFYEQEMQRILSGFPSTEDEGIELPIVVHYPIDEIKKGFMGMIIDTCKGSGKIKFVSSDKEDLHSDWFPADVLKAALMAKIFNL